MKLQKLKRLQNQQNNNKMKKKYFTRSISFLISYQVIGKIKRSRGHLEKIPDDFLLCFIGRSEADFKFCWFNYCELDVTAMSTAHVEF